MCKQEYNGWSTRLFTDFDDAKRYVINAMENHADDVQESNEDLADEISGIQQDVNLESAGFSVQAGNYVYFVQGV